MSESEIKERIAFLKKMVNGPSGSFGAKRVTRCILERSQKWLDEIVELNARLEALTKSEAKNGN